MKKFDENIERKWNSNEIPLKIQLYLLLLLILFIIIIIIIIIIFLAPSVVKIPTIKNKVKNGFWS